MRLEKKEIFLLIPGTLLAIAGLGPEDPWIVGPCLFLSWVVFIVICIIHVGPGKLRGGVAIVITIVLAFVAVRRFHSIHELKKAEFLSPASMQLESNLPSQQTSQSSSTTENKSENSTSTDKTKPAMNPLNTQEDYGASDHIDVKAHHVGSHDNVDAKIKRATAQVPEQKVPNITQGPGSITQIGGSGNSATINNYGSPPLPIPNVKICVSQTKEDTSTDNFITEIKVTTDVQILRPFFMFFFDAPVDQGKFDSDGHMFGCTCPVRATKLPNPEQSIGFRLTSMDFGTNIWHPSDGAIRATISSKTKINLIRTVAGGGDDDSVELKENLVYSCQ